MPAQAEICCRVAILHSAAVDQLQLVAFQDTRDLLTRVYRPGPAAVELDIGCPMSQRQSRLAKRS